MIRIDDLAKDFLAQQRIAIAGVSRDHENPANLIYRTLRERGVTVFGLNPHLDTFDGDPCYPDVASLPETPDGLVIVTRPAVAEDLVRQCIEAGVPRVWMHNMLGTHPRFMKKMAASLGSVSPEAVRLCRENGIAVIPGSCPMQFLGEDFPHTCMRGVLRVTGALQMPA
ncbi:MAG TPA: CoA-binding protein [Thermoanaerobaculia bacterium]|nr:CoA-binding protein [Thermoanaerobaculia bacterium]